MTGELAISLYSRSSGKVNVNFQRDKESLSSRGYLETILLLVDDLCS